MVGAFIEMLPNEDVIGNHINMDEQGIFKYYLFSGN